MNTSARSDLRQKIGFGLLFLCAVLLVSGLWMVALTAVEAELGLPAWASEAFQLVMYIGAVLASRGSKRVVFALCGATLAINLGREIVQGRKDATQLESGVAEIERIIGVNQCRDVPGRNLNVRVCVWRKQ